MAVTQNTYTGNGSTVLYSFTFPYLETTDIKVSLNGTVTTAYTLANATTIQFTTAPANGAAIRIYRQTDDSNLQSTFYPGSAIRSSDLNDNFTQNLYVTQEANNVSAAATTTANSALAASASATSTSNTALSQSSTALSNSTAAVSTANTASANAATALSQSSTAVTTANTSLATANSASSSAASALSASSTASSNAATALSQSNTALSNSSTALSQSTTALSNSASAVTTANTASTNASTAISTANTASTTANNAAAAVANAQIFTIVAAVANIPGSPANNAAIEVTNSTGIESFTPLAGKPAGFVGNSGLSVRITYSTSGSTWNWVQYFPNDPENRYLKLTGGSLTGAVTTTGTSTAASFIPTSSAAPSNGLYLSGTNTVALATASTGRLFVDANGLLSVGTSTGVAGSTALVGRFATNTGAGAVINLQKSVDGVNAANIHLLKSRGTLSAPTIPLNGDNVGQVTAMAYDGSAFATVADLSFYIDGVAASGDTPGGISIKTRPAGVGASNSERVRITSSGLVGINTSTPDALLTVNGVGAHGLGSAAAPSFAFTGDLNTGIYSPGADQVAISTNGTGRLFVDASGKVSIGVATFSKTFNVIAADASINLRANSGGTYTDHGIFFAVDGVNYSQIYNDGVGQLIFRTGSGLAERMRLDSSGRLGLGTSAPTKKLQVEDTSATSTSTFANVIARFVGGASNGDSNIQLSNGVNASANIGIAGGANLYFGLDGVERMRLDSSGRLGLGNSAPGNLLTLGTTSPTLEFNDSDSATDNKRWVLYTGATNLDIGARTDAGAGGGNLFRFNRSNEQVQSLQGFKDGAAWFHVDNSTARVGIGTTSPAYALDVVNTITGVSFANSMHWNYPGLILRRNASNVSTAKMLSMMLNGDSESDTVLTNYLNIWGTYSGTPTTGSTSTGLSAVMNLGAPSGIAAHVNGSEAFRVDASRRLLVGTSTASAADASVIVQGNAQSSAFGSRLYLSRGEANPVDNVGLGQLNFSDSTHTVSSMIRGARDGGTWGASSKPGRLEFSTTADGASSPTERMRIGSNGAIRVGQTTTDAPGYQNTTQGISLEGNTGGGFFSRSGSFALHVNRITNDGDIVVIAQDGTQEGSISVNGTTVSYNGAHLSRWSQLPGNAERIEILRGTVLSNIDEMCGWGEEDNEQLNRMKVSDIEGDPNVSGVFQAWDDDDDTYTDDFYCAMTGDFIIRIAEGVTVQRGDLLMSAGDGSAKPQDDDIVRSKTVAKVTSTHVTCTYDDGSYCVPCVLMAC